MLRRSNTALRFISALDEHAGHSWLASVTQLQSRHSTARKSGITEIWVIACILIFLPIWFEYRN
jgi:hypothetical protein